MNKNLGIGGSSIFLVAACSLFLVGHAIDRGLYTKTACSGVCAEQDSDHSKFTMACPLGQKISIDSQKLEYRWKKYTENCPNTLNTCQDHARCCNTSMTDCQSRFSDNQVYDLYRQCSGHQRCGWLKADAIDTPECMDYKGNMYFASLSYKCVDDSTFLDMCSNESLEAESVNLLFNGSRVQEQFPGNKFNRCICVASASDCLSGTRLMFHATDVRLQYLHDKSTCHPHSQLVFIDKDGPKNYSCAPHRLVNGYDIYYSNSPYAKLFVDSVPGNFPSQVWLRVKATMPGIKIVISCGYAKPSAQTTFCGPREVIPTLPSPQVVTTESNSVFEGEGGSKVTVSPDGNKDMDRTSSKEETDLTYVVIGAAVGGIVLIILIVIICFVRHKRKPKQMKTLPPPDLRQVDFNPQHLDTHYYEFIAEANSGPQEEAAQSSSKVMATFTPRRKTSEQFFGGGGINSMPLPPIPVSGPVAPPPPPSDNSALGSPGSSGISAGHQISPAISPPMAPVQGGFYHTPWDNVPLGASNRAKRNDLAYATSDEIQVLIQRMEHDRRQINEGTPNVPDPKFYIHIDNYKISRPPSSSIAHHSSGIGEERYHYNEDEVEDSEDEDDDDDDVESDSADFVHAGANVGVKSRPKTLNTHARDQTGSEDTGYPSVGSPDQVLVTEDDYLIPGSVKSSISSEAKSPTYKSGSQDRASFKQGENVFPEESEDSDAEFHPSDTVNGHRYDDDPSSPGAGDIFTRL